MIGICDRAIISDGKPVEGWLINYKRPIPSIKSTFEKELYGRLSELDLSTEDWFIMDPKDNDIRETATSNLIFVRENELIIPEKKILQGIVINKLIPELKNPLLFSGKFPKIMKFLNLVKFYYAEPVAALLPCRDYLNLVGLQTQTISS